MPYSALAVGRSVAEILNQTSGGSLSRSTPPSDAKAFTSLTSPSRPTCVPAQGGEEAGTEGGGQAGGTQGGQEGQEREGQATQLAKPAAGSIGPPGWEVSRHMRPTSIVSIPSALTMQTDRANR
jgi:hypothetical protein